MHPPTGFVEIGTLGRTFQLEGGLRFYALGRAEAEAIAVLETLFIPALGVCRVERVRAVGTNTIVYLAGVSSVEAAKSLVNQTVYAQDGDLPEVEDAHYLETLLDTPVTLDGEPFGVVTEVIEAGGQNLLVVTADAQEHLIPLGAPYVVLEGEAVVIRDPPEGLLSLHKPE